VKAKVGFSLPNDTSASSQGGRSSNSKAVLSEQLRGLCAAMERYESKNVSLFLATAQVRRHCHLIF
jgi:hypothetical protein